ncbi:RING finger protein 222 isoform X2 [Scleropages formosus]|uniref:RING finger protein 222 isoform X2 n=1 Tax=Scleropages formosus TaxID=113540 RepID=UPI0010FABAF5|nr:RING finger protein 222-like isoform X2 [Scleropages formosus]
MCPAAVPCGGQSRVPHRNSLSPSKRSGSHEGSLESSSSGARTSQGSEPPHCQGCISYDGHMKRLSCGHTFCDSCTDRIVNQAFLDIEGLCNFPCPMCKSLRELGLLDGGERQPTAPGNTSHSALHLEVIKEEEEEVAGD